MNLRKAFFLASIGGALFCSGTASAAIQNSPIGAVSACGDGTFSTSAGKGTCSGHGDVLRLLTPDERSGKVPFNASATLATSTSAQPSFSSSNSTTTQTETQESVQSFEDRTETLPETGGEPLLMSLSGALLAIGSVIIRRRISM